MTRSNERRHRSMVLVATTTTILLVGLVLSWNTPHIHAIESCSCSSSMPMTMHPGVGRSSRPSYTTISRGGSLDESSSTSVDGEEEGRDDEKDETDETAEENPTETSGESSSASAIELATALRLEGKEHHDRGDFVKAAEIFRKAADTLSESKSEHASEDYATCRMHQALCHLKSEQHEPCIDACTELLQDGASSSNNDNNNNNNNNINSQGYSPTITARAYHRRAKAKMALGDNAGALQDARTASFLGDGKAVNLYGKLMRETSSSDLSSLMNPLLSSPASPSSSLLSPQSALMESLLSKSSSSSSTPGGFPDFSPASLLLGSGGNGSSSMLGALGSGSGGMAKSVVKNLVKKLDDESTQQTICSFLQKTNKAQLVSLASMAGVSNTLGDAQLDRLVRFCHGVTPRGIRRTVKGTKLVVYCAKLTRRTFQVINKYKSLIVAAFLLQWTKSAVLRPLPIDSRAAKKAAKLAAKAAKDALKDAMKASRAGFF
mmetsp:Transcript_23875/g.56251  ORF Transcript_23875/g.56251 Transcript_23875/m.56251 type:complete len:491 (-) Transcript_23875:138-1610(-)